jgi:1,2-diacylglycerol 3-alpha-glucosyltransferase
VRIAIVSDCYWPRINGVTVSVQTYGEQLIKMGHEVLLLCPAYPASWGEVPAEPWVKRLKSGNNAISSEDRLMSLAAYPAFFRALDRFKPEIIHINTEFTANIAARIYAKARGYPLLVTSHTDWEDYVCNYIRFVNPRLMRATVRFLMRALYRTPDVVITPSRNQQRKLKSYHILKRFIVIPTGISSAFEPKGKDEVATYRESLDGRFPMLRGKRLLLFAGRITVEKDAKFLLPVLRRVIEREGNVALVFVGDGPARTQLEGSVRRAGLSGNCVFIGYVGRAELPLVYAASEVFVFPSKTETQGLCTIEAMCCGLPIVAIGEMGTLDVMRGDNGGFMVRNDEAEFAEAVLRLLEDEGLREAKSREAIEWSKQYRIEVTTERLVRLYEVLAARHARQLRLRSGIK